MRRKPRLLSYILIVCFLMMQQIAIGNDGAYMGSGSNLIPITDSSVSVQKEVLRVTRVEDRFVEVDVYYEFYNKDGMKDMVIGFEATSPMGDVSTLPLNGEHPYMSNFTVNVNGEDAPYDVAIVDDSIYYTNGKFRTLSKDDNALIENLQYVDFFYVYYFKCKMKNGLNVVKHTYRNELSGSIDNRYYFNYVLSAANRWDGGIIEDFTLSIDFGVFQDFHISKTFFKNLEKWDCVGRHVLRIETASLSEYMQPNMHCFIEKGPLVYNKKNFEIKGELEFISYYNIAGLDSFDCRKNPIYYPIDMQIYGVPVDDLSRSILKNLPFARRGYVFNDSLIQEYYEACIWYLPNSSYKPNLTSLTTEEQHWVLKWAN